MTTDELSVLREIMREELKNTENRMMERVDSQIKAIQAEVATAEDRIVGYLNEQIKAVQVETMKNAVTLIDAQFMKQFSLLAEGQEEILRKMPSEEDMDIIDGRLQEHDVELNVQRQEIEKLKKAL